MKKSRLYTPGPTTVPENILLAMSVPIIHHRHSEFKELFKRVSENLKYLFQTKHDVFILTSSGTGAMESAVCNLLSSNDTVLVVNSGKFGKRWLEICRAYSIEAVEIKVPYGKAIDPHLLEKKLKENSSISTVFLTHCETSTGVLHNIKDIARLVRNSSDALVVVDGISSVGIVEMRMDDWGLDVVITASQKGLMLPPGLSFIAVNDRAWLKIERSNLPRYYFDLREAKKALNSAGTPWTPAISLVIGLDKALSEIRVQTLESIWIKNNRLARAMRAGCEAMGLSLFPESPSDALTVIVLPDRIDYEQLNKLLQDKYHITIAGGQGELKGKIIRIAHFGYQDESDIIFIISVLGCALSELGWEISIENCIRTVEDVLTSKSE